MKRQVLAAMAIIVALSIGTVGCSKLSSGLGQAAATTQEQSSTTETGTTDDTMFTERDLDSTYDEASATKVQLSDAGSTAEGEGVTVEGNVIRITEEGTYLLSGTLSDGQIQVEVEDTVKVQIVLDGVSISNASNAPIYIKQADKVFVTLAEGSENTLKVTGEFVQTDDNNVDGAIFSKEDLTLNGQGSLTIQDAYGHGIVSKDDLAITSGSYTIDSAKQGLSGKNSVRIADGKIRIQSDTDGIHSENTENTSLGFVYIEGGEIQISAADDGIKGTQKIQIVGGTVEVTSSTEGMESALIDISGGKVDVTSTDDGLNATDGSTSSQGGFGGDAAQDVSIRISGGVTSVDASGDGLDSNGAIEVSGGEVYVSGPTNDGNGGLDYAGEAVVTGGTVVVTGSSGMVQNFGSSSTQGSILLNVGNQEAGSAITVKDQNGNEIASFTAKKAYSSVVISAEGLEQGSTYTVTAGSGSTEVTLDTLIYGEGSQQPGGRGGNMGQQPGGNGGPGSMGGQRPQDGQSTNQ
ncbi:carbohydrate-binding domain-containing protein [Clostridiaceae bacterium 68-1-5]|uniref:Carbohydrate-binding domain-containing protein n=1 Tax=Suipraeoptans intestinalis TaxID=2606628 RepID=A0A6N7UTH4_9FIRM|nr:carbohydrate-binding domain-containing protein [Suipraeoptans intestinalis]MSR94334.1 carbohydrate-binding domain-containing protein [Suipraeoptans intestinalis]